MANTKLKNTDITKSKEDTGKTITSDELATLQKAAAQVATLEKAAKDQESKLATLEKANKDALAKVADFEKAQAATAKTNMVNLVKGFTFIGEDDQAETVEALLKNKDAVLLATLQKAQAAIDEFATEENGTDATEDVSKSAAQQSNDDFDAIAAQIMKNRKGAK